MSATSFNLGAALQSYREESEITVLPAGQYTLEIASAKAGKAAKGPTIMPVFKIYNGPDAGKRVMAGKLSFSENALWKTFPILAGFGITNDFLAQANSMQDPIKAIADALVGRIADVTLSVDNWQGQDRNKIDSARLSQPSAAAPVAPAAPAPPTDIPVPAPAPQATPTPSF